MSSGRKGSAQLEAGRVERKIAADAVTKEALFELQNIGHTTGVDFVKACQKFGRANHNVDVTMSVKTAKELMTAREL